MIYCSKFITDDLVLELEMCNLQCRQCELQKLIIDRNRYFPEPEPDSDEDEEPDSYYCTDSDEDELDSEEEPDNDKSSNSN